MRRVVAPCVLSVQRDANAQQGASVPLSNLMPVHIASQYERDKQAPHVAGQRVATLHPYNGLVQYPARAVHSAGVSLNVYPEGELSEHVIAVLARAVSEQGVGDAEVVQPAFE